MVCADGSVKESTVPIHVADVERLTKAYALRLASSEDLGAASHLGERYDRYSDQAMEGIPRPGSALTSDSVSGSAGNAVTPHDELPDGSTVCESEKGEEIPTECTAHTEHRYPLRSLDLDPPAERRCISGVRLDKSRRVSMKYLREVLTVEEELLDKYPSVMLTDAAPETIISA